MLHKHPSLTHIVVSRELWKRYDPYACCLSPTPIHLRPLQRSAQIEPDSLLSLLSWYLRRALFQLPDLEHSWSQKTINLSGSAAGAQAWSATSLLVFRCRLHLFLQTLRRVEVYTVLTHWTSAIKCVVMIAANVNKGLAWLNYDLAIPDMYSWESSL